MLLQAIRAIDITPNTASDKNEAQLQLLAQEAYDNNWPKAMFYSDIMKIERLISNGDIARATQLFESLINNPFDNHPTLDARRQVIELTLNPEKISSTARKATFKTLSEQVLSHPDSEISGKILKFIGIQQYVFGDYSDALFSLNHAYLAFETTQNDVAMAEVLTAIGNLYADQDKPENALAYFKRSLGIIRINNDRVLESMLLFNISMAYKNLEQFELAKEHMQMSLELSEQLGDSIGVTYALIGKAFIESELGNWDSALTLFTAALPGVLETGSPRLEFDTRLGIAKHLGKLDQFIRAEEELNKANNTLALVDGATTRQSYLRVAAELYLDNGRYVKAAPLYKQLLELEREQFRQDKDQQLHKYQVQFDLQLKEQEAQKLLAENSLQALKIKNQAKQQYLVYWIISLAALLFVGALFFVVLSYRHANRFRKMALKDFLTNAPNRRSVLKNAEKMREAVVNESCTSVIAIIDIDNFKQINDRFGHETGDNVLKAFALCCEQVIRQDDSFGRYGGEEWLMVLCNVSKAQVGSIFERMRKTLNNVDIKGFPSNLEISFTMGATSVDPTTDRFMEQTIKRADDLLYQAKKQGKDRLLFQ